MYNTTKNAQVAAYFTSQEGSTINYVKLLKLMYLSDRECMGRYGFPISYDQFVSMDKGPVLSHAYDLIKSRPFPDIAKWLEWISPGKEYTVISVKGEIDRAQLMDVSDAEFEILVETWNKFGHMNEWDLVDYVHKNCEEWEDPKDAPKNSLPIDNKDIFLALGIEEQEAEELANDILSDMELDRMLAYGSR